MLYIFKKVLLILSLLCVLLPTSIFAQDNTPVQEHSDVQPMYASGTLVLKGEQNSTNVICNAKTANNIIFEPVTITVTINAYDKNGNKYTRPSVVTQKLISSAESVSMGSLSVGKGHVKNNYVKFEATIVAIADGGGTAFQGSQTLIWENGKFNQ
ncbi:hypothetical protein [Aneurinibacillus aneurinilyticus]|jgi:hypothetical protein|nr:hypothetical protein [Aneurinibacillus aneurinilyticus]MCI1692335.1 hypothetical protein [Aneurinibacillus aneurinilyticus]